MKTSLMAAALLLCAHGALVQPPAQSAIARSSCDSHSSRNSAAKSIDSAIQMSMSTSQFSSGCGHRTQTRYSDSPPPTSTADTRPCDANDIRTVCEAVAAAEIAACDPQLGYTGELVTYPNIDVPTYRPAPYPNASITCNTAPEAPPIVVTEADFRSLPLTPSTITVGPAQGWVPVNMIAVVYTDPQPQTLTTTLLGQPVTVRATPTRFAWDWADGSALTTTTDPGRPWPDHTVAHPYLRTGTYTVTMTTTWTGEYSLDAGATYTPIDGTAATTSTAPPLTVSELRTHLVEDFIG